MEKYKYILDLYMYISIYRLKFCLSQYVQIAYIILPMSLYKPHSQEFKAERIGTSPFVSQIRECCFQLATY